MQNEELFRLKLAATAQSLVLRAKDVRSIADLSALLGAYPEDIPNGGKERDMGFCFAPLFGVTDDGESLYSRFKKHVGRLDTLVEEWVESTKPAQSANYYETDTHVFFYGSCYSQWAMRNIQIGSLTYNCAEQYMMSQKAKLFEDDHACHMIMMSEDPAEQKAWGKKVKNFNQEKWEEVCRGVVYAANYAKFTQHHDWRLQLLMTGDKVIVEASPTDRIWGVGLSALDLRIRDPENWRGDNWLGEAIMQVREQIRKEP
jgi:ribA/ribD-fused uncharacterized protein